MTDIMLPLIDCVQNNKVMTGHNISYMSDPTINKTKKNKKTMSAADKKKIWNLFDEEKKKDNLQIECVFEKTMNPDLCAECDTILMIMDDGFPTCTNPKCGIIYKSLDYSPEWRYYGAEDKNTADPTRCGNPINPLLLQSSFGCKIMCNSRSSYEMRKIQKWTEWVAMPHNEKSLYEEFQFITIMAQNAGIPKIIIDEAMIVHKDISEQKMFRGVNRDAIKAASIYISCRLHGCPRTPHEIAEIFYLDKTSATHGCSFAVSILHNVERNSTDLNKTHSVLMTSTPSAFIHRFCSKLNMNVELTQLCEFIAKKVEDQHIITDNTPQAVACGIVLLVATVCNLEISKLEIKQVSKVSEVTINKSYKKLNVIKKDLIPKCLLDKYGYVDDSV